jgi:hypothetical protein
MKSIDKNEAGAGFAGRTAAVVALLMIVLTGAGVRSAQAGTGMRSTAAANPADSSRKVPATSAAQSPAKGTHEGIGVHGYWTIDVRNPDGTLAKHIEFENGLCPSNVANTNYSGDYVLAGLLLGGSTGGWAIELGNPTVPVNSNGPPCGVLAPNGLIGIPSLQFMIIQAANSFYGGGFCAESFSCFGSLSAPTANAAQNAIVITGSFTVPSTVATTSISAVGTAVSYCGPSPAQSSTQCLSSQTNGTPIQITGAYLTGVAPMPAAITVVAGQTVSVTVQISFH